jgi:hypothetical protein
MIFFGMTSRLRWKFPAKLSRFGAMVSRRLTRQGRLFAFLRRHRHESFDEAFQAARRASLKAALDIDWDEDEEQACTLRGLLDEVKPFIRVEISERAEYWPTLQDASASRGSAVLPVKEGEAAGFGPAVFPVKEVRPPAPARSELSVGTRQDGLDASEKPTVRDRVVDRRRHRRHRSRRTDRFAPWLGEPAVLVKAEARSIRLESVVHLVHGEELCAKRAATMGPRMPLT